MDKYFYLEIPGKPIPYSAHRDAAPQVYTIYSKAGVSRKTFSRKYNPRHKEKLEIQKTLKSQYLHALFDGPLIVRYLFRFPMPHNWVAVQKEKARQGLLHHTRKPDVSNLVKFYEDCMKGIVFTDDSLVTTFTPLKIYADVPMTQIWIRPYTAQELQDTIKEFLYAS